MLSVPLYTPMESSNSKRHHRSPLQNDRDYVNVALSLSGIYNSVLHMLGYSVSHSVVCFLVFIYIVFCKELQMDSTSSAPSLCTCTALRKIYGFLD